MSKLNLGDSLILDTDYSESEVKTGATWVDGKPIYRKVFDTTATFSVNVQNDNTTYINHNINNFGNLAHSEGWYIDNGVFYPLPYISGKCERKLKIGTISTTQIGLQYYYYPSASSRVVIILEYTKTTD